MKKSKEIALCGIFAALAVVIMCFGGMIPFMTYVCPVICIVIEGLIFKLCGRASALSWYAAVCILSLLLCPDKEAAALFLFLGYYPIVKHVVDRFKLGWLIKILFFNTAILVLYWILMNLMGMGQLAEEFSALGTVMTVIMLVMGNVVFLLIDKILDRINRKLK